MRKSIMLVLVFMLMAFTAVPSFAQDEPGTIADIVVASSTAETPEFTVLLTAVQAADPAVLEALSDPEAELTVFAPTDAAFTALTEALGEEAVAGILADPEVLTEILLFHVVEGAVMSADVVALLEEYEGSFSGPTLQGQYLDVELDEEGNIWINGAGLVMDMIDIEASNGVIHVIDAVLVPESRTIAEVVTDSAGDMEAPEFTMLLAAVGAADPAILEALSDPEAELTVFAPTDAAFEALGEDTIAAVLADQAMLSSILMYHVVDGTVHSEDLGTMLGEAENMTLEVATLNGANVTFTVDEDGNAYINGAMIVVTDVDAVNGVIHVIDAVILPPAE